jgi:hypothetical protein
MSASQSQAGPSTAVEESTLVRMLITATVYDLLLAPFVVPVVMAMARRLEDDPLAADTVAGSAGGETLSGWVRPTGLRGGGRFGKPAGIGRQRSSLLTLTGRSRSRAGRIKGVKRL